jgi:hypothetical protein
VGLVGGEEELARVAVSVGLAGKLSGLAEEETVRADGVCWETVWLNAPALEPAKLLAVEENTAVIGSVPTARTVDGQLALPEARATVEQRVVAPEEKVTVPVIVPVAVEETVSVKVVDWP